MGGGAGAGSQVGGGVGAGSQVGGGVGAGSLVVVGAGSQWVVASQWVVGPGPVDSGWAGAG